MKITKELFDKYLKGECTPEEVSMIEDKINSLQHIDIDRFLNKEEWEEICPVSNENINNERLNQIYQKINAKRRNKIHLLAKSTIAAAIILIIYTINLNKKELVNNKNIQHSPMLVNNEIKQESHLIQINSSNQNMELICSDGSIITVEPNSEVRYLENFEHAEERIIQLKGNAKFKVTKNKQKPFRVTTSAYTTTALGTTFVIKEDNDNKQTKIELIEGKIEVKSNKQNANKPIKKEIVSSGMLVINNIDARIINEIKPKNNLNNRDAFFVENKNELVFKNLAIDDILYILAQNYNITINKIPNSYKGKYFSGTFKNEKQAYQHIIDEINYLHNLNISYTK